MQITSIERHAGSGMWHGTAIVGGKNHTWFYRPRSFLRMAEQDEIPALFYEHRAAGWRTADRSQGSQDG